MRQIRRSVFETNSSSVHSLSIVDRDVYDQWKKGEVYYSESAESFYTQGEYDKELEKYLEKYPNHTEEQFKKDYEFKSYGEESEYYYEKFEDTFTTKSGDEIVAFGYYGHD